MARAYPDRLILAEHLTLAVLLSGVASLALSDFVSPFYWSMVVVVSIVRLRQGPVFALRELYASLIGWAGLFWVGMELLLGRAWIVAFTDFLLILSLAVIIEEATPRNHLHRMLVGFFLILGAAVLTDSVLYVLPLAAFLWFVWRAAECLYGMQLTGGDLPLTHWRVDLRLMAVMVVATGLIFVLLPRFDFHSYLKPVQPRMQTSGFSASVQLGDFARQLNPTVVLRVEALDGDIERFRKVMMGRYWRGRSLSRYTGSGWEAVAERPLVYKTGGENLVLSDRPSDLRIAVFREASDHPYLFVPDGLSEIENMTFPVEVGDQGGVRYRVPPSRRLRVLMSLQGRAMPQSLLRAPVKQEVEKDSVPLVVNRWAEEVAGDALQPVKKLKLLEEELHGWKYDLNAPIDDVDPVGSFMRLRRGHCELYATILALAARAQGIPARVVNGYSGGEWNEVGGFYLIRQQHAHSWIEAWVGGQWRRFDPTPSSRWQLTGVSFPALDEVWESIKLSWYRYILEFQDSDRGELFRQAITLLKRYFIWLFPAFMVGIAVVWTRRLDVNPFRSIFATGRQSLLDRWLTSRGVERKPFQTLRHLTVPTGVNAKAWQRFVRAWEAQCYGQVPAWNRWELKRHLRAL